MSEGSYLLPNRCGPHPSLSCRAGTLPSPLGHCLLGPIPHFPILASLAAQPGCWLLERCQAGPRACLCLWPRDHQPLEGRDCFLFFFSEPPSTWSSNPGTLGGWLAYFSIPDTNRESRNCSFCNMEYRVPSRDLKPVHWMNLLLFSHWVVSSSLWPHGLQQASLLYLPLSPGVCLNSFP